MTITEWDAIGIRLSEYLKEKNIPFDVTCDDWNSQCGNVWFTYNGMFFPNQMRVARIKLNHALRSFNDHLYKLTKEWVNFTGEIDHYPNGESMAVAYFY